MDVNLMIQWDGECSVFDLPEPPTWTYCEHTLMLEQVSFRMLLLPPGFCHSRRAEDMPVGVMRGCNERIRTRKLIPLSRTRDSSVYPSRSTVVATDRRQSSLLTTASRK
jgi:hypothetical protein